jgi:hypothetical protein
MASSALQLSPLERDLLLRYHLRYKEVGFPNPDSFVVTSREDFGAGRVTCFAHDGLIRHSDGKFGPKYSQFNMQCLEAGASFMIYIEKNKISRLEIVVNGLDYWDGSELDWSVCDPDTGSFDEAVV